MASSYFPSWLHAPSLNSFSTLWNTPTTLGHALVASLSLSGIFFLAQDLNSYLSLPLEIRGTLSRQPHIYFLSLLVRIYRSILNMDGTSPLPLCRWAARAAVKDPLFGRTFLADLGERRKPRPGMVCRGVPHRQVPQVLDTDLEENLKFSFRKFATAHDLTCCPSLIEPNALALFLPPTPPSSSSSGRIHPESLIPRTRKASSWEFVHLHGGEGSLHLILSPLDAALAIEKGWACRFPLAGGPGEWGSARGRVLLYAPRDEGEVRVVMGSVRWSDSVNRSVNGNGNGNANGVDVLSPQPQPVSAPAFTTGFNSGTKMDAEGPGSSSPSPGENANTASTISTSTAPPSGARVRFDTSQAVTR
ncbi:hypothetical protein DACRYDRAFT_110586 [Dacryopinax primogenitus]|uniref:Luciferase domain-containing protein n=1 Tax=Dacryopinax primogenitus (strain DJM 731) TaxID=1858805 RepID=M5FYR7_DACPD|nr:uncharacterized protein DACRYDRAFT_110586 [Dacryopinax primogenitus]EJT98681.1 hypothetical protein DACRYDRAFT_110586 [Dacryopinax primogenitus]